MSECQNGSCETGKDCCCDSECAPAKDCCTIAEDILCLAKEAKHELLKEKMKKVLEAKVGKKLDAVATIAVDALIAWKQSELAAKEACENYKEKLFAAFKA